MTFNGVMALILRYFTEFGSFRGALRKPMSAETVSVIGLPLTETDPQRG